MTDVDSHTWLTSGVCKFSPDLLLEVKSTVLQGSRGLMTEDEDYTGHFVRREMMAKRRGDTQVGENGYT